ncbi:tRNA uridine-5-carboxymethylaminomethyl(34) synthesis GTPase MnmE [Sphingomonas sp. Leaf343]|uniref:tRNA uridine-5-carboxymethylaminomethyl(34) synthesis GTPase MnmE n=1 Tax=Sphingomonas sp. Leaf343 TaxID=1736345 RepID=UPI0006FA2BB4|nr:tRNA uridine-5-carboxymethylaminomethyl(34) synthesis GTPase MnmE [Sphingomonas sp. Leaf343]KQR83615.1 tRNA modification GTPase TrmE [Sphingomonas sp. Leaf343]
MTDTIAALSSGQPPAAIAVIRVSGPVALAVAATMAGTLPPPRTARVRTLRHPGGMLLDRVLMLIFPGPATATGEDLVEIHCHGGRAVVAAIMAALIEQPGVRLAQPGEFTRRAVINGRLDVTEAEGLADLLAAETETQRRMALAAAEGSVSRSVERWMTEVAILSARIEALLDYGDEDDVHEDVGSIQSDMQELSDTIRQVAAAPSVDALHRGVTVVLAGPPNAGKSTLFNLLVQQDAAIVSPVVGTTRDRIEVQVARQGMAYRLTDTAGLTATDDLVEAIGVDRARQAVEQADILLWLGDVEAPRADAVRVHSRRDVTGRNDVPADATVATARDDPSSIEALWSIIQVRAEALVPTDDLLPLKRHQQDLCVAASAALSDRSADPLLLAENLRLARLLLAEITGANATDLMLDALFSRFCLGK